MERKVRKLKIVIKSPEEIEKGDELIITEKFKVINTIRLKEGSRWDWRIVTTGPHNFQFDTEDLVVISDD